jgi:hypothetical protein
MLSFGWSLIKITYMKIIPFLFFSSAISLFTFLDCNAQDTENHSCGTTQHMNYLKKKNPALEQELKNIEIKMQKWGEQSGNWKQSSQLPDVIPVVVHVLYSNTAENVSDQAIYNTIQALNEDYGRTAPDTNLTPAVWKPIAASTNIQFCLAQRDPNGDATNGIERRQTTASPFDVDDFCKFYNTGGLDAWDVSQYFNIWICDLVPGLGGYGEFPTGSFSNTFGNVTDYTLIGINGWVASHESGHCFNLRHIWGDDGGSCSFSDNVADTPNQGDATQSPCPTFPHTDACQPNAPGIMFMNYMDYGSPNCKNIFTQGQAARTHSALYNLAYSSLLSSPGCQPIISNNDAGVIDVTSPSNISCDSSVTAVVKLKNFGVTNLTSVVINMKIVGGNTTTYTWNGTLLPGDSTNVSLPSVSLLGGYYSVKIYPTQPNGVADQNPYNDTTLYLINVYLTGTNPPISQGFQNINFPNNGWLVTNPDGETTWQRDADAHHMTAYSLMMNNFNYPTINSMDEVLMPNVNLVSAGNIPMLTFWLAYASRVSGVSDTLEVLVSTDCGANWTSVYKKWTDSLSTAPPTALEYIAATADWRQEVIDLFPFSSSNNVTIKFRNINNNQNNLYIDDVNLTFLTAINESLNGNMIGIYPNPTTGIITLNTSALTSSSLKITLSDAVGKIVMVKNFRLPAHEQSLDLSALNNGIYLIHVEDGNGSFNQKLVLNK